MIKEEIKNFLMMKDGRASAVTSRELTSLFNIEGKDLRPIIHDLRVEGVPICSCNRGYYYSEDKEEVRKVMESLNERAMKIMEASYGLEQWLKKN